MTTWQRIAITAIVIAAVLAAWLGRYEVVTVHTVFGGYKLDRWTGKVWALTGANSFEVGPVTGEPK